MKRTKEEKELRQWTTAIFSSKVDGVNGKMDRSQQRIFKEEITALIRAVRVGERERCAKVAEGLSMSYFREAVKADSTYNRARNEVAAGMGNAIRKG